MVALQIISKVLQTKDLSIIEENQLTEEYFPEYEEEFKYIMTHVTNYGNVPDKATFLAQFPQFEMVEVTESDQYLIDTIREENLYVKIVPIIQQAAKLLKTDSNSSAEYLLQAMKTVQPNYGLGGVDIISQAEKRYNEFISRRDNQEQWFFTTGFPELDDAIHGIQRGEELFVLFARTNVGYISPEMGNISVGYRFDTLYRNFKNSDLMWGNKEFDEAAYKEYIEELKKHKNKFVVATPSDFARKITVSKLKNWVNKYKLDLIAIDGITYLSDERYKRGDNKTTTLTNISEDLMSLSVELGIPVLIVVQANRSGVVDKESDDTPELESIRDSDGISHNATTVLSIRQSNDGILTMQVKKGRNCRVGDKIQYQWNPNIGEFISTTGSLQTKVAQKKVKAKEDVF